MCQRSVLPLSSESKSKPSKKYWPFDVLHRHHRQNLRSRMSRLYLGRNLFWFSSGLLTVFGIFVSFLRLSRWRLKYWLEIFHHRFLLNHFHVHFSILLAQFPYFEKMKAGLRYHHGVCMPVYIPLINFWMSEPIFRKLSMFIMAPKPISTA
jgi:hypothetical protein